jgi:hypothetical protein
VSDEHIVARDRLPERLRRAMLAEVGWWESAGSL